MHEECPNLVRGVHSETPPGPMVLFRGMSTDSSSHERKSKEAICQGVFSSGKGVTRGADRRARVFVKQKRKRTRWPEWPSLCANSVAARKGFRPGDSFFSALPGSDFGFARRNKCCVIVGFFVAQFSFVSLP